MEKKTGYRIRYTHIMTGERLTYLNSMFELESEANKELCRIKKEINNRNLGDDEMNSSSSKAVRSTMIGVDWSVEKFQYTPLKQE